MAKRTFLQWFFCEHPDDGKTKIVDGIRFVYTRGCGNNWYWQIDDRTDAEIERAARRLAALRKANADA